MSVAGLNSLLSNNLSAVALRVLNFSRPFFEQFRDFRLKVPSLALFNDNNIGSENCEYTQDFAYGKNCYMTFARSNSSLIGLH